MEKSRLFVVLIFVTAIPIIISKNAKEGVITDLAHGMIVETNNELRIGIIDCLRRTLREISFLTDNHSEGDLDDFRKHFRSFNSVSIVDKEYNPEITSGQKLDLGSYEWGFVDKALSTGRPSIFVKVTNSSRIYLNFVYPYKADVGKKTGKKKQANQDGKIDKKVGWKCVYAVGDFTDQLATYTKPVKKPMAIFRYVYDSTNKIILPSFSKMALGVNVIKFLIRNLNWAIVGGSKYMLYRSKVAMPVEEVDITGLHAISVIPSNFMNHITIEYRIKTNAILIIIFLVLAVMFADIYRGYSRMENKLDMYKGIVEDAGVAIVLFDLKSMAVISSNRIARNLFYIEVGFDLKYLISKASDREYITKVLTTIGSLYNYKLGIRARYNEEVTVILSLAVNLERNEGIITFFEENAVINKHKMVSALTEKPSAENKGIAASVSRMLDKFAGSADTDEDPNEEEESKKTIEQGTDAEGESENEHDKMDVNEHYDDSSDDDEEAADGRSNAEMVADKIVNMMSEICEAKNAKHNIHDVGDGDDEDLVDSTTTSPEESKDTSKGKDDEEQPGDKKKRNTGWEEFEDVFKDDASKQ